MMSPDLAKQVVNLLNAQSQTVTVAESCTGGGIAYALTSVPGASGCFQQGFITYSDTAKAGMLGVDPLILARDGAVSENAVRAMAAGAIHATGADFSVSVSGVAGPEGGSAEKPVGTVWIAWHDVLGDELAERFQFTGDREAVRKAAVHAALSGLLALAKKSTV